MVIRALLAALPLLFVMPPSDMAAFAAGCPERPACKGCGCKGGPGYRGPDGRCVSFRNLTRICGTPPTQRCDFENAPGTGDNRECALAPRKKKK